MLQEQTPPGVCHFGISKHLWGGQQGHQKCDLFQVQKNNSGYVDVPTAVAMAEY